MEEWATSLVLHFGSAMSEEEIFHQALACESLAARGAFLDRACAGDSALRAAVESLLRANEGATGFLDPPTATPNSNAAASEQPFSEAPGVVVGAFKLVEQIGEGGMGTVWMAHQTEPVRRVVALKLIKAGMDSKAVIARFEAERQALALMDHANIARVLDAGATSAGRPYFVMELVKGVPITKYCDERRLTPRQRMELFIPVCQAVHHAHQKGIIHRDLKPSNVLVALYDDKPVPKIIDFGVAKATGRQLTDKTLLTAFGAIVGTLEYMSPEQAQLNNQDIDTRSDVYSLGVLLYELLTGTTPLERTRIEQTGIVEALRIIREEEPPTLTNRVSTTEELPALAANRGTEPARLAKLLRGEPDWIVRKALEKDRDLRYATANDLALDVRRHLTNEPVLACPPSAGYRLRKLARRHGSALATCAFFVVVSLAAVIAVAGTIGWAARGRKALEDAIAQDANRAVDDSRLRLGQRDYSRALASALRAKELMARNRSDARRARVLELCRDLEMVLRLEEIRLPRPVGGVEGAFDNTAADSAYASAFRQYGIDADTLEPAEAARRVRGRIVRLELTVALDQWARARRSSRETDDRSWKRLIAIARAADDDEWRNQVRSAIEDGNDERLIDLASSPKIQSLPLQTLSLLGQAIQDPNASAALLKVAQREHPGDFWINFQTAWSLAHALPPSLNEAVRYYTAAAAVRPRNAPVRLFLGNALRERGDVDDAIAEYRKAVELNPEYATAHHNLAAALWKQGRREEALAEQREAVRIEPNDPGLVSHLNWLVKAFNKSTGEGDKPPP